MKRPHSTFVVEVRKQRRPTNGNGKSWLTEPRFADSIAEAAPASEPLARLETPPSPPAASGPETTPARPTGRILPSLIDLAPTDLSAEDAAPSRRGRGRLGGASKARKATRQARREAELANVPAAVEDEVALDATAAAARASAALEASATTPAGEDAEATRADRHRRVMERYVFGPAQKSGQRWKRRLLERRQ
jgi:hypothetical protein